MPPDDPGNVKGLVDAALSLLIEARRRNDERVQPPLGPDGDRRLIVAITTVSEILKPEDKADDKSTKVAS